MTEPSDGELVRGAQAGEVPALAVLLERHRVALHAHALGILGHGPDAQDAVQDTLLTAMSRVDQIRDPDAVAGWLHAVLRNACLARRRGPWPREASLEEAIHAPVVAADLDPEQAVDRMAMRDWVWTALDRLSEPLRLVAMLRFFGAERSYEEIAAVCGVPVGTVRSRLSQVRAKLAEALLEAADLEHRDRRASTDEWTRHFRGATAGRPELFLERIADDVVLELRSVGVLRGRAAVAAIVEADLEAGVGFVPVDVTAGAQITILEARFVNPPDDPDHCPPGITQVHFHADGVARRMAWHRAARPAQDPHIPPTHIARRRA